MIFEINCKHIKLIIRKSRKMQNSSDTKPYFFIYTDHDFYFKTRNNTFNSKHCLKINRLTSKIEVLSEGNFEEETRLISAKFHEDFWLIVGVICILQEPFLVVVTQCEPMAIFMNDRIYEIRNVKFIPFKHRFLYSSVDQTETEKIIEGIRETIIANHFYFCYKEDITLTYDKRYLTENKPTERKYFWNQHMLKIFSRHHVPLCWRIPIMQGYVSEIHCENKNFTFYYANISRRSKHMSGTRFNSRGLDYSFNAANFVETEEIFVCHNLVFSHVSLRGSVPIFWEQPGFGADIKFPKDQHIHSEVVIKKHYELLEAEYGGEITTINLLSKTKSTEKQLRNRFEFFFHKVVRGNYLFFDLNEEMKGKQNGQKTIDNFILANMQTIVGVKNNFFCLDRFNHKVYSRQRIIPRINCFDCLDRTNVIMARISELYLKQVEQFINNSTNETGKKLALTSEFTKTLIDTWTGLGNRISQIYCGTESVATHMIKKQNNSFFSFLSSGIKSINRYYNANVNDSTKQECLEYWLGLREENSQTNYFEDNITNQILDETKYCTFEELGVFALTWNCNMVDPQSLKPKDFDRMLEFSREEVDIIIIGLQEMVELNSYNVLLGNNETITGIWKKTIINVLNQAHEKKYEFLTGEDLVGIATFVFVSQPLWERCTDVHWVECKTGFKGSLGNKGANILFMKVDSSPITIINCHLAAGESKSTQRLQDIEYIHRDALHSRLSKRFFDNSQFRFFLGDMNFRLESKNDEVRELLYSIEKQDQQSKLSRTELGTLLSALLHKDQFKQNCRTGPLSTYSEPEIYFLPTYKYVKGQKNYDTKRTPSWCDRILFHRKEKLKLIVLKYQDVQVYVSDHKPVIGAYRILIKNEDRDKRKQLIQMYYKT